MIELYDLETFKYAFVYCYLDRDTLEKGHFEISFRQDDTQKIIKHLQEIKGQIGFNNIEFDWVVLDWLINNYQDYNQHSLPGAIYDKVQEMFEIEGYKGLRNPLVPQLDLYRIWHYNNKARSTSLKWLEFAMRMQNIEDLPYDIEDELTSEMIDELIEYCHHDVKATYKFYKKSIGKVELRKKLQLKYKIPLLNRPDVGMAEDLILDSYCKKTNQEKYKVKQLRSEYDWIQVQDIILPCISFKTTQMQEWLEDFKPKYLKAKGNLWKGTSVKLYGETYDLGLGGIHIKQKAKAFYKKDDELITEKDCASLYPTIISKWGFYPHHLGPEFLELYSNILQERMQAKSDIKTETDENKIKELDLVIATNKLMLNSSYGKLGSDLSYMYDLKMLYSVTVNNQLMMLMLIEEMGMNDIKIISANTDSITTVMKKSQLTLSKSIEKKWEFVTRHVLEDTEYECIIYRDVNNYISKTTNGKVKSKGCFEYGRDFHKNHSMMIVPLALEQYYINNIKPEEFIKHHQDIFDFCKAVKGNRYIKYKDKYWNGSKYIESKLQTRANRYILVNRGSKLIKIMKPLKINDGSQKKDKIAKYRRENPQQLDMFHFVPDVVIEKDRESEVEAGYYTQIMNRIESLNVKDYDINYEYYENECYKIINQIQLNN